MVMRTSSSIIKKSHELIAQTNITRSMKHFFSFIPQVFPLRFIFPSHLKRNGALLIITKQKKKLSPGEVNWWNSRAHVQARTLELFFIFEHLRSSEKTCFGLQFFYERFPYSPFRSHKKMPTHPGRSYKIRSSLLNFDFFISRGSSFRSFLLLPHRLRLLLFKSIFWDLCTFRFIKNQMPSNLKYHPFYSLSSRLIEQTNPHRYL